MNEYHQPDFYRFNQDSLALIFFIKKHHPSAQSILDLGAGCGIIGIELARYFHPLKLTLVEVQDGFRSYLARNVVSFVEKMTTTKIQIQSFENWQGSQEYDLISCNPPYYLPGHGEQSQNKQRGIARSFMIDNWSILLSKINTSLSPLGVAYLVVKNDKRIMNEIKRCSKSFYMETVSYDDLLFLKLSRLNID